MTIAITGGSGFIGTALTQALLSKGNTVVVIDTQGPKLTHENLFYIPCNLEKSTLPFNVLERTDAVIHLARGTIGEGSTDAAKERMRSRATLPTKHLIESIEKTVNKPPIVISASSIAYYGEGYERDLDERSARGTTTLSEVVEAAEREVIAAERLGCRVVIIRSGAVLGPGGFLSPLLKLARFHLSCTPSKEDNWMPWIHLADLVRMYLFALETSTLQGPVNAVSPTLVQKSEFMRTFARETKSMLISNSTLCRLLVGDPRIETMLNQKVHPQRLIDKGFAFAYTNVREAIASAIQEWKKK